MRSGLGPDESRAAFSALLALSTLQARPDRALPPRVSLRPDDPAFIMFTSHSTSVPNGVLVRMAR